MTRTTKDKLPGFVDPQLATLAAETPNGPQWVHEVKFDGYRAQVRVEKGKAMVSTRRGYDWTSRFKDIAKAASPLPDCLIDGEAVVLDRQGRTDFSALQSALAGGRSGPIVYFAFDLLFPEGHDLRGLPLLDRKKRLAGLLKRLGKTARDRIRYSEHFSATGPEMHKSACAMGLEGVVSKRVSATYRSGRNDLWLKSKCGERETLLIGGWRQTAGGIQSLAMGEKRNSGFEYVGKARTGFQEHQAELLPKLKAVEMAKIPFTKGRPEKKDGQHWCEPELQAEVSFTAWTASRHLRHAKFLGLREDLTPIRSPTEPRSQPTHKGTFSRNVQRLLVGGVHPSDDELKAYWKKIGTKALKYLGRRPLTLVRHDRGRVFFHTGQLPETAPSVHRLSIQKREGGEGTRLWVDTVAGLMALVDIGVVELHPWNSTVEDLEHPDQMVLDLDPGEGIDWEFVRDTALLMRDFLKKNGFTSSPKATGGKGLHLMIPLDGNRDHDEARQLSHQLAGEFAKQDRRYTTTSNLQRREGHLFIDYLRNGRGATAIGTYSPRARTNFPVAIPMTWKQVEDGTRSDFRTLSHYV